MENLPSERLITVLMPVYNAAPYLKETIESILHQTYTDFELLIINDCSTDNSLEVIRSFPDPRIVVHTNAVNLGQTKSLNVGLKLARGKYIAINDADDLSLPKRLQKQIAFMGINPDVAVVGANAFIMDKSGKKTRRFLKNSSESLMRLNILFDTPVIHGSVLMNKETILRHGGYREDIKVCQDYELWSRLLAAGEKLCNLNDILVSVRYFSQSLSFREGDRQLEENAIIMQSNYKNFCKVEISMEQARRQRLFFAYPQKLSDEEFTQARQIFIETMKNFEGVSENALKKVIKRAMIKPYCRLTLAHAQSCRVKLARQVIKDYFLNFGFALLPMIFFVFVHCNGSLVFAGQKIFNFIRRIRVITHG